MREKNRMRIIKQDTENMSKEVSEEPEIKEETIDTELLAAVSYKLNENTILIRNILSKPDGGHSEMELAAFVDALAAFEIAGENPQRFVEVRAQYFKKEEEETEESET